MRKLLRYLVPDRWKNQRAKIEESRLRDEQSDRLLADLQERRVRVEAVLRDRQRRNHWQESIDQLIREGR